MRARKWLVTAKLSGPIALDILGPDTLQLELGKSASRVSSDGGPYVGGAYVQLSRAEVGSLIEDLQAGLQEMAS